MRHIELKDFEKTIIKQFIEHLDSVEVTFDKVHPYIHLEYNNEKTVLPMTFLEMNLLEHHTLPESKKIYIRELIMKAYPEIVLECGA